MKTILQGPPDPATPLGPLWKRLAWFFGLALLAAMAAILAAYAMKAVLTL
mgnify:CR=1 FL=1